MNWKLSLSARAGELLVKYSGWFIFAVLAVTSLLVPPIFLMAPTQQASQDPGGPVFELQERVQRQFPPRIHGTAFIVEARVDESKASETTSRKRVRVKKRA